MLKKIKSLTLLALCTLTLASCQKENQPTEPEVPATRTVLVYLVGDNNLYKFAIDNINAMEKVYDPSHGTQLLVLYNRAGGSVQLLDIKNDGGNAQIVSPVLKTYADGTDSCDPATLAQVIDDVKRVSPTGNLSIVFWSHANGWFPHTASGISDGPQTYTFGDAGSFGSKMEIDEMAKVLPADRSLDYIYFDACHMGSIESIYELRNAAKYIIASPSETLATGYPYEAGLSDMLTGNIEGMISQFKEFYKNQWGTIAAVDTEKLEPVAQEFQKLVALGGRPQAIQEYGTVEMKDAGFIYHDLEDLAVKTWGEEAVAPFLIALNNAVPYKETTDRIYQTSSMGIDIVVYSGLSVWIPRNRYSNWLQEYTTDYQWAHDTQLFTLAY